MLFKKSPPKSKLSYLPLEILRSSSSSSSSSFSSFVSYHLWSRWHYLSLSSLVLVWSLVIYYICFSLPRPVSMKDATAFQFSEDSARQHIHQLSVSIGARVVGTPQELEAIDYLYTTLKHYQQAPKALQPFQIRLQEGYGHHLFEIIQVPIIKAYFNVTNIAVRFPCQHCISNHSVLVNSHFDSTIGSNGAADAATPIAVMLECVRMLSQRPTPLRHSIVFLFNGAEETLQDASHAFIQDSDWFKDVVGVINLEAGGVGGKAMLFQAKNKQMLKIFSHVTYPHGSSLANDLFRTGLIISDTDYKQFMDHGNLHSGLDIAFYENSYLYHTQFDTEDNIAPGSVQHMGQNTIDMLHYISDCDSIEDLSSDSGPHAYLDLLGRVFIFYSSKNAKWVYWCIIFATSLHLYMHCRMKKLLHSFLLLLKSIFYSLLFPFTLACLLHFSNLSLLWFSSPVLPLFLYLPPIVMGHLYARTNCIKKRSNLILLEEYEKQAQLLFLCLEIIILMHLDVSGVFFHAVQLVSVLFTYYFIPKPLFYHVQFLIPFCIHLPSLIVVLKVFVPLTGRMGASTPSELVLVIIFWLFSLHLMFFFTPLFYRCSPSKISGLVRLKAIVVVLTMVSFKVWIPPFTSLTPQRLVLFHYDVPALNVSELHLAKVSIPPFPSSLVQHLDKLLGPHHVHPPFLHFTPLIAFFPFTILLESLHWNVTSPYVDSFMLPSSSSFSSSLLHSNTTFPSSPWGLFPKPPNLITNLMSSEPGRLEPTKTLLFECHLNKDFLFIVYQFQAPLIVQSNVPIQPYRNHTYYIRQTSGYVASSFSFSPSSSSSSTKVSSDCDVHITVPFHSSIQVQVFGIPNTLGPMKPMMKNIANMVGPNVDLLMLNAIVSQFTL